jgi:hypothetical protein
MIGKGKVNVTTGYLSGKLPIFARIDEEKTGIIYFVMDSFSISGITSFINGFGIILQVVKSRCKDSYISFCIKFLHSQINLDLTIIPIEI